MKQVCVLSLFLLFTLTSSWRVLFVNPFAGMSHQAISSYLANLLAREGHHVTYLSTNIPSKLHPHITKLDLPKATSIANSLMDTSADMTTRGIEKTFSEKLNTFRSIMSFCDNFYDEDNVQSMLKSKEKFDLMVAFSAFDCCSLSLGRHLNITNSVLHASGPFLFPVQVTQLGLPVYASSSNLDTIRIAPSEELKESMWARAKQLVKTSLIEVLNSLIMKFAVDPVAYRNVPSYTGYKDMYSSVRMLFMHYHPHPLVDLPFPMGPGVVGLGGTTCQLGYNEQELSDELREFVDGAEQGFLLISFGSHVSRLKDDEVELWGRVFSSLPYRVVWRLTHYSGTLPSNVRTYQWLPQRSLLNHPKIKLFISHGGYGSKIESICTGVPILLVPRFAEQYESAQQCVDLGVTEQLHMASGSVTESEILDKIHKTMTVHSVTMKELKRQVLLTRVTDEQVLGYLELAVAGHTLVPGYQPWWEYLYLDLILVPVVVVLGVRYLVRRLRDSKTGPASCNANGTSGEAHPEPETNSSTANS